MHSRNLLGLITIMLVLWGSTMAQDRESGRSATPSVKTSIAAVTKGSKEYQGYFNFYYDSTKGKIYLEVDKFDQEFLYFCSLPAGVGSGGPERGQAAEAIAKFIRVGSKILLIEPNYDYRSVEGNEDEKKNVEDAFAKSVIWGFEPLAIEGNKVVVDLTPFLLRDCLNIGGRLTNRRGGAGRGMMGGFPGAGASSGGGSYHVDPTRSAIFLPSTKDFPLNSEFEAMITFTGGSSSGRGFRGGPSVAPDPTAITVRMHQSFVALPDSNYKPRKFDPRSGLNMLSYMDFSAPMGEPIVKRFTRRHRLQKKDPNAKISEPVEPIVYYVDRGAPPLIKKAIIEGGSWWNEAFEAAGFKNAFQVKELPEGADPMDIRYNVVNWIDRSGSPRAFSSGASYIDPRTGEIIKGVITLGSDRHRQDYLIAEGLLQPYEDGKRPSDEMEQMALARLRQLAAHEIGHTLGMFHNFTASTKDRASVMDYPFPRIKLKPDGSIDLSDAYAKGIGGWDKRAIIWGYTEFPKGTDEDAGLDSIMKETLREGYIFIPDVGGYAQPLANQWDDGADPISELGKIMAIRDKVLSRFSEKAIPHDAPMATLEEVLVPIYLLHRYQIEAVAKSVGGLYFTPAVKNDGQVITRMIEPAVQWKAFDALMGTITPEALALPEDLIRKIPPRPSGYPANLEIFSGHTGPAFDPIAAAETAAGTTISSLLDPERAARLIEYHARDPKQPGLLSVLDSIIAQTWKAPIPEGYKGQLKILVDNLTLKYLLALAADATTGENVRGEALLKVEELKQWMQSKVSNAEPQQKATLLFGLSQIGQFEENEDKFQPAPALDMPPGAPIGMTDLDFLSEEVPPY